MHELNNIIPPEDQEKWLRDNTYSPLGSISYKSEIKYQNKDHLRRFKKLQLSPDYEVIMELASIYIQSCIMYPATTIRDFWSCTCYTSSNIFFRINMGGQEVFTVEKEVVESMQSIAKFVINEEVNNDIQWDVLSTKYEFKVGYWGRGRISIYFSSFESVSRLMTDPNWLYNVRKCNHYLMQRKNNFAYSHNYVLSQAVFNYLSQVSLENELIFQDQNLSEVFPEGDLREQTIRIRQRSKKLVWEAKQTRMKEDGRLSCAVCDFNYLEFYGSIGEGFIEAHHLTPLAETGTVSTSSEDIVLVCANCHRMMHRRTPPYTIEELQNIIAQ